MSHHPTLSVQGATDAYPIYLGEHVLEQVLPTFIQEKGIKRVAIISNDTVAPLYGETLQKALPGSFMITVPDGEQFKTLDTIRTMYSELLKHGVDRSTVILALGGGVIGDMAGFAAATYMRGVRLIQCPTTVLAMVDSSIGGKTGVDVPEGKNLIGAFKDPIAVFSDTSTLRTLPPDEVRYGMSEVVKSALIADPDLLTILEPDDQDSMIYTDSARLQEIIQRTMQVKVDVVEQDRLESGVRAFLNLGHTFAHPLELLSHFRISHGYAVAIGLVAASHLSHRLGLCDGSLITLTENTLRQIYPQAHIGCPLPDSGLDDIWEAMHHDKKWRDGRSHFVLLRGAGQPESVYDVDKADVMAVLEKIREPFRAVSSWNEVG